MSGPPLYFTRAALRRDTPAASLQSLLSPSDASARAGAGHRVVWTLFGDRVDRERDFLWREADDGLFYFLSRRPPEDRHGFFELSEPKPFAPEFAVGDRLHFSLRANATVARKTAPDQKRGKPCDVVMDALFGIPIAERASVRHLAIDTAGVRWLAAQGMRCGFFCGVGIRPPTEDVEDEAETTTQPSVHVTGYRTLRVDHAGPVARIGVIDLEGELEVRDPALFLDAIGRGFGRAKAFGCGLMMVRRA